MDHSFSMYAKFFKKLIFTRWYTQMTKKFLGKCCVPTKLKVRNYADNNTF